MKISKYFLSLFMVISIVATANAQINASRGIPSYTNYEIGDLRVSGQQVWNVNQDKNGFLFVGTSSGLQKFDGLNWKLLTSPIQQFNTNVRSTLLSSNGILYYGSLGDFGYVTQDSVGNSKMNSLIDGISEDMLFNDIWSIKEVGGKIYFQSREAIFIYTLDLEKQEYDLQTWRPETQFMYAFSHNNQYYVHQINRGLFVEKEGQLELIPTSEFLGENRVQVLLPYRNERDFLVGAFSGGLFHYDGSSFTRFKTEIDHLLQEKSLYKALALPNDTYAISVLGFGFFILDQEGKVVSEFNTTNSIPDQSVYSFHLDTYSNLWVGTNSGLSKIELFSPLTRFDSDEHEVGNVLSITSNEDQLYIGTSTNVLYIDKNDGTIKKIKDFGNSQVFDLERDDQQIIASGEGVYTIKGDQATAISALDQYNTLDVLISKKYPGYLFMSGSFGMMVFHRKKGDNDEYVYREVGLIKGVDRFVYTIIEDAEGDIWAGTQSGNIYRIILPSTRDPNGDLDIANAQVFNYTAKDGVKGMSGLIAKVHGKLYASGIEGFFYFEKTSQRFIRDDVFSFSDEVADVNLDTYGLGSDSYGNVYLVFKGEARWAKLQSDGSYVLNSYPLNLVTASFTTAGYTDPNEVLWVGTDEGLLRIDPNQEYKVDYELPLYFTSIESMDKKLLFPDYVAEELPKLPFSDNSISFNFVAPFFIKENLIEYQTFLEGFDQDWQDWDSKSSREFTNLPYGTYTFRVKALNRFNTISRELTYSFVVLPPWYATIWAFAIYVFILILFIWLMVRIQSKQVIALEQKRAREMELKQAKEIEKAYKELKSTQNQLIHSEKMASLGELTAGIAHEIQNPLNFVNNFSDLNKELIADLKEAVANNDKEEIADILKDLEENEGKVTHHGKRAEQIVKSMLQHSRNNPGEKELTDINALCDEYLRLAYHGFRAKDKSFNADFKLESDGDLPWVKVISQDLGRVLLNLINNAFQAVHGQDDAQVIVSTKKINNRVQVSVSDNGPGIPDDIRDKIFQPFFTTKPTGEGTGLGLSMSYDIITKGHKGQIEVDSAINQGTSFIITIPIES